MTNINSIRFELINNNNLSSNDKNTNNVRYDRYNIIANDLLNIENLVNSIYYNLNSNMNLKEPDLVINKTNLNYNNFNHISFNNKNKFTLLDNWNNYPNHQKLMYSNKEIPLIDIKNQSNTSNIKEQKNFTESANNNLIKENLYEFVNNYYYLVYNTNKSLDSDLNFSKCKITINKLKIFK